MFAHKLLLVHDDVLWCCHGHASADGQPFHGVLVVGRPCGDDGQERQGRAAESDEDGEFDVLEGPTDEEGNGLSERAPCQRVSQLKVCGEGNGRGIPRQR